MTDLHLRDLAWALITSANAEDHVRLWGGVVARVPPTLAAAPLCLLGMAAWVSGAGALLNCCCERLAQVDPHYSMGRLLAGISEKALPPSLWQEMGGEVQAELRAELGCTGRIANSAQERQPTRLGVTRPLGCVHDALRGVREALIDLVPAGVGSGDSFSSTWLALSAGRADEFGGRPGQAGRQHTLSGPAVRDAFGRQLRQHILEANVKLDLATESSQATSIAVVSLDEQGVASYTFHFNDTANFGWQVDDLPELPSEDWLHIASLSCIVSPGAEVLLDWMRDVRSVSYDINVRHRDH